MSETRYSPSDHPGRRESSRYPIAADVEISSPVEAHGVVINASEGGLRIAVDRLLPFEQLCVVEVATDEGKTVEMCRVAWRREYPDGFLIGLSFVKE